MSCRKENKGNLFVSSDKHLKLFTALLVKMVSHIEFEHFCRTLIKCVLCWLITFNGNLGFFCMTDNHIADSYHRGNLINENTRKAELPKLQYLCEGSVFVFNWFAIQNNPCASL